MVGETASEASWYIYIYVKPESTTICIKYYKLVRKIVDDYVKSLVQDVIKYISSLGKSCCNEFDDFSKFLMINLTIFL